MYVDRSINKGKETRFRYKYLRKHLVNSETSESKAATNGSDSVLCMKNEKYYYMHKPT